MNARTDAIAYGRRPASVTVQSVLYGNRLEDIERSAASLARAADLAIGSGACSSVSLRLGDCSPLPCLAPAELAALRSRHGEALAIDYEFFGTNLGSAAGHNRLAEGLDVDFVLIRNPDVVVCPRLFESMLATFALPRVGIVEAKQLPIEHPKDYDPVTGETVWATTACALVPMPLFRELGGFDAESFFLYCDDVDFSWRVRERGLKVIYQADAVVFHDKRLSDDAHWQPSAAERYYSAEAALMLAHKWSRADLVERWLRDFGASDSADLRRARESYERRAAAGKLPAPRDAAHRIGVFHGVHYARHRFAL